MEKSEASLPENSGNRETPRPPPLLQEPESWSRPPLRTLLAGIAILFILLWQGVLASQPLDNRYSNKAASGMGLQSQFVYYLHYLNLYPITSTLPPEEFSVAGAEHQLKHHGETLLTEVNQAIRWGDHARTYLFLLDTHLKGSAINPSIIPANRAFFTCALIVLFLAFQRARLTLLGGILVILIGSDPFQLYETYFRENVFGWMISTTLLLLALHLPLLQNNPLSRLRALGIPLFAGILLGSVSQVRPDSVVLVISCTAVILLSSSNSWPRRLLMVALLIFSLKSSDAAYTSYFHAKYDEAAQVVRSVGGVPLENFRKDHHHIWHALYCGLGDFDYTYGHKWDDRYALAKAWPILQQNSALHLPEWDFSKYYPHLAAWSEGGGRYFNNPYMLPEYMDVIRGLFLQEITESPLWYLRIILRRGWEIFDQTTPLRLSYGTGHFDIPWHGLLYLPLLAWLGWRREWFLLQLLLFPLAISLPSLLIFAGKGMTYYSIYHLFAAAIVMALGLSRLKKSQNNNSAEPISP